LNVVDGVFVPPVGDAVGLADQANRVGEDAVAELVDRFDAAAVLAGGLARDDGTLVVTLRGVLPDGRTAVREVRTPLDPRTALPAVTAAAIDLLGLPVGADERAEALAVARSAPTVEGLQAVGLAATRVGRPDAAALRAATELAPDRSWAWTERARLASLVGAHEDAAAFARTATDAQPADVEAWTVRGAVARRAGDDAEARDAFRRALEGNPAHAIARAGLADLLDGAERSAAYRAALEAYPRLLEAHVGLADEAEGARGIQVLRAAGDALPDATTLHATVVDRALAAGDAGGAAAYLREVLRAPMARRPGTYALAARLRSARPDAALELLQEGRERFPDDVGLAVETSRSWRAAGDAERAEAVLAPFADAAPDVPRVANAWALALVEQGRLEEARAVFAASADDDPTVRYNFAVALLEAGFAADAAAELAPDMGDGVRDAGRWAVYGAALAASGREAEGRDALARALDLDADQPLARRTLDRLDERARVAGDDADPLPPEARAAFDRGLAQLEQGRNAEAVEALQAAYDAAGPSAPLVAAYLGNALQRTDRLQDAVAYYEEALAAYPDSGAVQNDLGFAFLRLGRYDRALPTLRDAVANAPEDARAHLNLGLVYYGLSRFEEALAAWDRAVALEPELAPAIARSRERAERNVDGERR
ncbi:MAG: tetratricopeptide repeat protein, partial [Trueperaceae bacterium]|nr:tetratricopeptide repeat protein [Trueperaceae bacterium]